MKTRQFLALAAFSALFATAPVSAGSYVYKTYVPGLTAATSSPPLVAATYSFSNCGQSGRTGPALAQCQTAYASQPQLLAALGMPGTQGYQEWTVPSTGNYTITAAGAGGGTTTLGAVGGGGAIMRATLPLTQGDVLQIVVGQAGINAQADGTFQTDGGGGGGTFVVRKAGSVPLVVAGGGGGANYWSGTDTGNGGNGTTATSGGAAPAGGVVSNGGNGGTAGNGASGGWGEPGAGFLSNGGLPGWNGGSGFTVAKGFAQGAIGGISTNASPNRFGGFGGGAGAHGFNCIGGGAGGGYSGGGAANQCGGGGGGGSYVAPGATGIATSDGKYNGTATGISLGFNGAATAGYVTITSN
jgi:hypothetical protein